MSNNLDHPHIKVEKDKLQMTVGHSVTPRLNHHAFKFRQLSPVNKEDLK